MQSPDSKVDMAQMNAAIDKVLALPVAPKAKEKARSQREAERPPPAKSSKNVPRTAAR